MGKEKKLRDSTVAWKKEVRYLRRRQRTGFGFCIAVWREGMYVSKQSRSAPEQCNYNLQKQLNLYIFTMVNR